MSRTANASIVKWLTEAWNESRQFTSWDIIKDLGATVSEGAITGALTRYRRKGFIEKVGSAENPRGGKRVYVYECRKPRLLAQELHKIVNKPAKKKKKKSVKVEKKAKKVVKKPVTVKKQIETRPLEIYATSYLLKELQIRESEKRLNVGNIKYIKKGKGFLGQPSEE